MVTLGWTWTQGSFGLAVLLKPGFGETRGGAGTPVSPAESSATSLRLHGNLGGCFLGEEGALSQEGSWGPVPREGEEDSEAVLRGPTRLASSLEVTFLHLTLCPKPKSVQKAREGEGLVSMWTCCRDFPS